MRKSRNQRKKWGNEDVGNSKLLNGNFSAGNENMNTVLNFISIRKYTTARQSKGKGSIRFEHALALHALIVHPFDFR